MAKVHHVKKAMKDNSVCKKGESYYWWKPYGSGKRYSKDYPKGSQLCSGRKSEVMATQENLTGELDCASSYDEIRAACESASAEFRDQADAYNESAENMREYFPDSEQADNMEAMAESLEEAADTLDGLDFDGPEEFDEDEPEEPQAGEFGTNDEYEEAFDEWQGEHDEWTSLKEEREEEVESFMGDLKAEAEDASENIEFMF